MRARSPAPHPTALIAHPGAELYGSDRVMLETVSALVDDGWEVLVSTPVDGPLLDEVRRRGARTLVVGVPVLRKSMLRPLGLLRLAVDALAALVRCGRLLRAERPDVVYVSTVTVPTWLLSARLAGVPAVAHVHEAERGASRPLRAALVAPLLLAERLLVNSRFSLRTISADLPALERRAVVLYNGVPGPEHTSPARTSLGGALRIAYVGRLSERKGVHVVIDAVAALRRSGLEATADLLGGVFPGYEWYEAQLREQVARLDLAGHVRLLGFSTEVWTTLAAADVAVVPSIVDEPFGNTAVEAVLAARPVVVSHCGGLPEAVEPFSSSRTVPPGDPDALADAVRAVAADWTTARTDALADAERARGLFGPERYRREIAREIASAAGRRRGEPLPASRPGTEREPARTAHPEGRRSS